MANLLFAIRESDSLRSENPRMSQPSRGLVLGGLRRSATEGHAPPRDERSEWRWLLLDDALREHRHSNKLGEALSLHLCHNICSVNLDRARADPKFMGQVLVRAARSNVTKNLLLPHRKRAKPL